VRSQSEQRGDLVLVQRGAPAQRREDKPTRLRTPGFLLHAPHNLEVRIRQLDQDGVLKDFIGGRDPEESMSDISDQETVVAALLISAIGYP
jgi:hypothetical protein